MSQTSTPKTHRCLTWLGHASWLIETPGAKRVLVDPWLDDNPKCPEQYRRGGVGRLDLILATHGHGDHVGDLVAEAQRTGATVVAIAELAAWAKAQGVAHVVGMNKGGSASFDGLGVTLVDAVHSSSFRDANTTTYTGEACGIILELEDGFRIYHAGDTALFGDMQLIGEWYRPDLAILPIGGHYTMGPREAAKAAQFLGAPLVVPNHFGTWPVLAGSVEELRRLLDPRFRLLAVEPGGTIEP